MMIPFTTEQADARTSTARVELRGRQEIATRVRIVVEPVPAPNFAQHGAGHSPCQAGDRVPK
jgi:hypothetical protein